MCEKTLYNWVNAAYILAVSRTALPNQGVKYRTKSIATRLANAHSQSVVDFLDKLETKMGSQTFRRIFISVTCGDGPEFMDIESIYLKSGGL